MLRPMETVPVHLKLPSDLLKRIDARVDGTRVRSRTQAVIELLLLGLEQEPS